MNPGPGAVFFAPLDGRRARAHHSSPEIGMNRDACPLATAIFEAAFWIPIFVQIRALADPSAALGKLVCIILFALRPY